MFTFTRNEQIKMFTLNEHREHREHNEHNEQMNTVNK